MQNKTYTATRESVVNACKTAFKRLELGIEKCEESKGLIIGKRPGDLWSFGNKIEVNISSSDWHQHTVSVKSTSAQSFQLINWGTNDETETNIHSEITKILYKHEAFHSK